MSPHRARVMQLITEARGNARQSLCILGAGNANDIDLAQLADDFERITLVDIDEQALTRAIERAPPTAHRKIDPHHGVDLTGILPILSSWQVERAPTDEELSIAILAARDALAPALVKFDVVASTCILTQLIDSICMVLPEAHPRFIELVMAVRDRHLEMIIELLNPAGVGVLVTDFVATETAPDLARLEDSQILAAAIQWIIQRNFFTGANPYAIRDRLQSPQRAGLAVVDVQVSPAWRWDIGAKQLAVSAVTFRRVG